MAIDRHHVTDTAQRFESQRAPWLNSLAALTSRRQACAETRMRTVISCDVRHGRRSVFVPPDMSELQPRSLRYLHAFAKTHDLQLIEDRRRVAVQTVREQRKSSEPVFSRALSELLRQLGMPGGMRPQSRPHRLAPDSPHIDFIKLIQMGAHAAVDAKRIKIHPNRLLVDVLGKNRAPIAVYACKLTSADSSTVFSHFDSPGFRAIGYSAGKQYVMHVCVAGGSLSRPCLWADFHTLTRSDFRLQLLTTPDVDNDVGLIYATFYLDLAEAPTPWWLNTWANGSMSVRQDDIPTLLKRAS